MVQAAILRLLLIEHPAQLTVTELRRFLAGEDDETSRPGALDSALRTLVGAGLIHRQGRFLIPSRAALHFDRLPLS